MKRLSLESQQLIQYFRDCAANKQIATYTEMNKLIHNEVRNHRGWITTALKVCREEYGLIFQSVLGLGYQSVPPALVAEVATDNAQRKIKSAVTVWRDNIQSVDISTLAPEEQEGHFVGVAKLSLQEKVIEPETQKKIEVSVRQQAKDLTGRAGIEYARLAALELLRG